MSARLIERRAIAIRGIVQGVGFRPYVYGLASRLGLAGFVCNRTGSVFIEVEGQPESVDQFIHELRTRPPPLALIAAIDCQPCAARGDDHFSIERSEADTFATTEINVCPDIATCDDCLAELFDPSNRRWRYPFINCTNCGPRLTIVTGAPYDRALTTMAAFEMCPACRREYEDPRERRFHAQPVCCAACGPRLRLLDAAGRPIEEDPLQTTVATLRAGTIVAIKGLGGFHLACDARNESAVRELRRRKHRDEKPLAVMARDVAAANAFCHITDEERALLQSRARPIVLLRRRDDCDLAASVAPGNPCFGVMLPYTPLHHLLLHDLNDVVLVMTSGNRSDEPIAYEDTDAVARLAGIADLFLMHNRPIHVRCDDSVTQVSAGGHESPIRRSRGYAPQPLRLPVSCAEPVLAVGGQLKSTFALARERQAIVSHHLGDLDELSAFRAFERDIELYQQTFAIKPRLIVHDLHPDYASTRYALRRRDEEGFRCLAVQHHHAHMASCMAEHGLSNEPVIGVSFDGTGYGTDGAIWGGEFLVGDLRGFRRAAHLRYVPMPGGERAIKEPWRMAVAHLDDAGAEGAPLLSRLEPMALAIARQAMHRRINAPMTSSAGRLFDAVASLVGIRDVVSFEGQAAMQLQWLASESLGQQLPYANVSSDPAIGNLSKPMELDTRPLIRAIARDVCDGVNPGVIAARFHTTLCDWIVDVCTCLKRQTGIDRVALSGGVFMNLLLAESVQHELTARGFFAFRHRRVPPNDGGLSLGQLAIAAAQLQGW